MEIRRQLSDMGANIVITADSGELSFQYGGITMPDLVFDAATLSMTDLDEIEKIPDYQALKAVAPKIIGTATVGDYNLVIAGTHLPAEFAVKPWLRFSGQSDSMQTDQQSDGNSMEMEYELLNLERTVDVPELAANQVILGFATAKLLTLEEGDNLELKGKTYKVLAILDETGLIEDNQVLMNLDEARKLLNRPTDLTVIELAADFNLATEEKIITQLQAALPTANVSGVRQAVMGRNELLNSFSRFGGFAAGLIVVTGVLVVALTMSASVRERTREIGIFRAIGFRSSHIFTIIITESILVSALGGIVGYHSGLLASSIAAPLLIGSAVDSAWQLPTLLTATLITAATGGLASLYPAIKAANLDPAEALRFV
jgi:putative ABC transport system permease protein